ncbi:MAG: MutS-related protein [Anaerococcus sp.]
MELAIVLVVFFGVTIYTYFRKKIYIKNQIKNSWGKFPKAKIIDYLDEKELNESMEILKKYYPQDFTIDSYTWGDLDFFKIFRQINKGYSSIGQDYLFYRLRNYSKDNRNLEEFQKLKDFFEKNEKLRRDVEFNLYYIGKNSNFSIPRYIDTRVKKTDKRYYKIYIMGLLPIVFLISSILIFSIYPRIGIYLFSGFFISSFINIVFYRFKSKYLLADIKNSAYLGNFLKISKKFTRINIPNSKEIKSNLEALGRISFWMNFIAREDTEDPLLTTIEELKKVFLLPLIAFNQLDRLIDNKHMEVFNLFIELGKIEAAISCLNYQIALGSTKKPIFTNEFEISAKEVYHPLVKNPIGNYVNLERVNIITGSNASGKSTYVKSIAINAILAQTLNFVYAEEFKIKKAGVFTSMAIKDDVVSGDSYFIAEIKSLKRIVDDSLKHKSYYFIDEILKGTNTIERISASSSVINYLIEKQALAMIASHDIELTTMFDEEVKNIHFREYVKENGDIDFDYKLKEGPSDTRNAIRLLDSMGFVKEIVDLANKRANLLTEEKDYNII